MKRYTNGFEIVDDKVYLRTTTPLKIIDKPAIQYWFGKEVFYALSANPELSEKEALAMPYQVSAKAKDRGSTVHSIVEAFKTSEKRIDNIPQHIQPYAFAFYDFLTEHKLEMIDNEKKVYSDEHMLSGTLDIYGKLGDKHFIIDVKTGKDVYMEAGLQLSAYKHMIDKPVDEIAVLLLETGQDGKPTGKYKFQTMVDDFDTYLAAKKLWCYVNQDKCIKMGYAI